MPLLKENQSKFDPFLENLSPCNLGFNFALMNPKGLIPGNYPFGKVNLTTLNVHLVIVTRKKGASKINLEKPLGFLFLHKRSNYKFG